MKALSVRAPYAGEIIAGTKRIEYRSWRTHYRGRVWIHESGTKGRGIIGTVEIVDVKGSPGDFEWMLARPLALKRPVPCNGWLGIWEPSAVLASALAKPGASATGRKIPHEISSQKRIPKPPKVKVPALRSSLPWEQEPVKKKETG